ncbi:hypothetical protein Tco_0338759 [Tanacetum coccineum]
MVSMTQGIDLMGYITFKSIYPRLFALETNKNITVASKLSQLDLATSFRRAPRGGLEEYQFNQLLRNMEGVSRQI